MADTSQENLPDLVHRSGRVKRKKVRFFLVSHPGWEFTKVLKANS